LIGTARRTNAAGREMARRKDGPLNRTMEPKRLPQTAEGRGRSPDQAPRLRFADVEHTEHAAVRHGCRKLLPMPLIEDLVHELVIVDRFKRNILEHVLLLIWSSCE
jgi:hypothetical protein